MCYSYVIQLTKQLDKLKFDKGGMKDAHFSKYTEHSPHS